MIKKALLPIILSMSGCALIEPFIDGAAVVNDKAIRAAEFSICNGASVGSVKRRFNTPELAKLWRDLCDESQGFEL